MKKFFTVIAVAAGLLMAGSASAQMKVGYIQIDQVVGLMPETAKIDSMLERYQSDSLNPQYAYLISEYQRKDSLYIDSVSTPGHPATPTAVRRQIAQELPTLISQIQNWQSYVQQATENKQNEYLKPIYAKVYEAIKAVAKEKGYTHVFNKEAFLVAPDADDIIILVATKLKLKIPPQLQPGLGNKTGN